jgi:hypothetical protein
VARVAGHLDEDRDPVPLAQRPVQCGYDLARLGLVWQRDLQHGQPHRVDGAGTGDGVGDLGQWSCDTQVERARGEVGDQIDQHRDVLGGQYERAEHVGMRSLEMACVGRYRLLEREVAGWEDCRVVE